ncbi:MAG: glycosyltransferase [Desulfobulbaceae bacterium]|nr:glycosyltransferase [Desulfobulbaceae bacterium]
MRMRSVLWWGRSDREYSRNRLVLSLFQELGWTVAFFHPMSSRTGLLESYFRRRQKPDLIWAPCFRQTDIAAAAHWADKWRVPLIIDPLISAYQKEVFERSKWPPDSSRALKKKMWESRLFSMADIVVADTPAHADFFRDELKVEPHKIYVLYVSAEGDHFKPMPFPDDKRSLEVLFYGSFLPLQGIDVIIQAAKLTDDPRIRWTLLGGGDLRPEMVRQAAGAVNISFEPWIAYSALPERLSHAHILLGIFGVTLKAGLVIPNKMFQSMAVGRPVITRHSEAYRDTLAGSPVIGWVPPGDPDSVAELVLKWSRDTEKIEQRGRDTRKLFESFFGRNKTKAMLNEMLNNALKNVR